MNAMASLTLNHGVSLNVVSKRLGHNRLSINLDIFSHVDTYNQDKAAEWIIFPFYR